MALKRANGEGNLRKRSNGTWEARVTLGTDPKTGKLISKSVYARTQKECREKMKALLGIDGGQAATPPHRGAMAGHLAEGVPGRCKAQHGAPVRVRGAATPETRLR